MAVPSPCISVCSIDEATGYCKGCMRTLQEVADWFYISDQEKTRILDKLRQRKGQNQDSQG